MPFRPLLAPFRRRCSCFCSCQQRRPLAPFRRRRSRFCSATMTPTRSHLSDTAARAFVLPPTAPMRSHLSNTAAHAFFPPLTAPPPRLHLRLASPLPRLAYASPAKPSQARTRQRTSGIWL
ncbi:hypothetical protein B0H13DRAFT_2393826 [Mycena leptocephala]|nr:hypothetical protein B0H13DRAFT_2393826 [Mycena leptocephala]